LIRNKQDLLIMLLENEHARLTTWIFPLGTSGKNPASATYAFRSPADVRNLPINLLAVWDQDV